MPRTKSACGPRQSLFAPLFLYSGLLSFPFFSQTASLNGIPDGGPPRLLKCLRAWRDLLQFNAVKAGDDGLCHLIYHDVCIVGDFGAFFG